MNKYYVQNISKLQTDCAVILNNMWGNISRTSYLQAFLGVVNILIYNTLLKHWKSVCFLLSLSKNSLQSPSVLIISDRIYLNNDDIKFNTNYINNSVALFSNHYHQMNKKNIQSDGDNFHGLLINIKKSFL